MFFNISKFTKPEYRLRVQTQSINSKNPLIYKIYSVQCRSVFFGIKFPWKRGKRTFDQRESAKFYILNLKKGNLRFY